MPGPISRAKVSLSVAMLLVPVLLAAQSNVTTQHNDAAGTGLDTSETLLRHALRFTASDGAVTVSDDKTIAVNAAPVMGSGTGVLGEYFNDPNNGSHFVSYVGARLDGTVNFDWASAAPAAGVTSNNFSVRWTGRVQPPVSGDYTFTTIADDGVRVWVDGQLLIDNWIDQAAASCSSVPVTLAGGSLYDLKMEYYEHAGAATARLQWAYPGQTQAAIPQSQLYPLTNGAAVMNAGADRTITLPATCR